MYTEVASNDKGDMIDIENAKIRIRNVTIWKYEDVLKKILFCSSFIVNIYLILLIAFQGSKHHNPIDKERQDNHTAIAILSKEESSQFEMTSNVVPLFNSINPYKDSWCPDAICNNNPLCQPCKQRYLFILSPGRAGSTSLLTTFNLLPNVRLSGENNDELFKAYEMIHNLYAKKHRYGTFFDEGKKQGGPWMHNIIQPQSLACASQKILSLINPPSHEYLSHVQTLRELEQHEDDTIIGAKMIRIQEGSWGVDDAVDYFKKHFPCAKYIVNNRDPKKVLDSRIKLHWVVQNRTYEEHLDSVKQEEHFLKSFAQGMGSNRAVFIDMDEWINDVGVLNDVIEWLGYKDCRLSRVKHDNDGGYKAEQDNLNPLVGGCKMVK
ncbi:hypothetical protein CTEN210_02751 [Chaetoceros tenuissimus]|uniref:Uncharacterized protein n=1 Tax=Chaetoceros tenuissimus TaxID=426638 RepID=A0AAD3H0M3_9STRA|nr:hypothetical protein CTEN210_02751 [Chaetoceros tenuissimus]